MAGEPGDRVRCRSCDLVKPADYFPRGGQAKKPVCYACKCAGRKPKRRKVTPRETEARRVRLRDRTYGLKRGQFDRMLREQKGLCAICYSDEWGHGGTPAVDHNHRTGEVRGLLCTKCNTGLGQFRDNPPLLMSAVRYLVSHGEPPA